MQSRHPGPESGRWNVESELDQFLTEIDSLLAPSNVLTDRLSMTWPPPAIRQTLFPYGVFASRARFRHR